MPIIISLLVAGSLVLAPAVSADILPSVEQESGIPTLHPAPVDAVTEQIWDALKGKTDSAVARILAKVPVLLSGARDDGVYLGIGRDYWTEHGGKQLYKQLKQHFPDTPLHLAPSTGVIRYAQKLPVIPAPDIKTVPTLKRIASPITKTAPENTPIRDNRTTISTIEIPHDTYAGDITVTTNIDHSFRSDLQVTLVAPSGVQTTLFDGRQRIDPTDNLRERFTTKQLHGQQARGTWQLQVTDTEPEDTGTLKSWSLAITPAQKTTVTNPDHIFFETFQDGLNDWSSSHWRATTPQKNVPGEGEGNIVAQAHGCLFCSLTSKPLNLSAYNEVHLSYYYRLDPGMQDNEFLTLSTITNGTATKLKTYRKQHATGHWQQETITLTNLTPQTRIQFTAFARNAFTSFAIDNVLLAAPAGTITATDTPDLAVTSITAANNLFTTTLRNTNTTQTTHTVTFHKGTTTNRPISTITVTIPTNTTKQTKTALATTPGTYYACLTPVLNETDTENNCASITIQPETPTNDTVTFAATPPTTAPANTPITFFVKADTTKTPVTISLYRTQTTERTGTPISTTRTLPRTIALLRTRAPQTPGTYTYHACVDTTCVATDIQVTAPKKPPQTPTDTLSFTNLKIRPVSVQSTYTFTLSATITNTGTTHIKTPITIYQHTRTTTTPRAGIKEPNTITISLAPNQSIDITSTHSAPDVSAPQRRYYYLCTDTTCSAPTDVVVRVKEPSDASTPAVTTPTRPGAPVGGDDMRLKNRAGTITLGGVEDTTGVRGFIGSAHVLAKPIDLVTMAGDPLRGQDYSSAINDLVYNRQQYQLNFLGYVYKMPSFYREGEARIVTVDAGFVAYPHPMKPGCTLSRTVGLETFCLDVGSDKPIERVGPLQVRSGHNTVHTVIGSKKPVEGLEVQTFGSRSQVVVTGTVLGRKLLGYSGTDKDGHFQDYVYAILEEEIIEKTIAGDSGAPIYTVPDAQGNVYIVGVLMGSGGFGDERRFSMFTPWYEVEKEFNLKPISQ